MFILFTSNLVSHTVFDLLSHFRSSAIWTCDKILQSLHGNCTYFTIRKYFFLFFRERVNLLQIGYLNSIGHIFSVQANSKTARTVRVLLGRLVFYYGNLLPEPHNAHQQVERNMCVKPVDVV